MSFNTYPWIELEGCTMNINKSKPKGLGRITLLVVIRNPSFYFMFRFSRSIDAICFSVSKPVWILMEESLFDFELI